MSKHTPGPWTLSNRMCPDRGEGFFWVSAERTLHLMVAPCPEGFVFGENEANARIIAAAPELLEACKLALEQINANDYRTRDTIRAAIAKATGES